MLAAAASLTGAVNRIGTNINQIAKAANGGGRVPDSAGAEFRAIGTEGSMVAGCGLSTFARFRAASIAAIVSRNCASGRLNQSVLQMRWIVHP